MLEWKKQAMLISACRYVGVYSVSVRYLWSREFWTKENKSTGDVFICFLLQVPNFSTGLLKRLMRSQYCVNNKRYTMRVVGQGCLSASILWAVQSLSLPDQLQVFIWWSFLIMLKSLKKKCRYKFLFP